MNQYDEQMTNTTKNTTGNIFLSAKFTVALVVLCSVLFFIVGNTSGYFIFKLHLKKHQRPKPKPKAIVMEKNAAYCVIFSLKA